MNDKQNHKRALKPRLRFHNFRQAGEWKRKKVGDLIDTVTPPKKLFSSQYALSGAFPIIDQSQQYISGWTDDQDAIISEKLPLIVFGDHTCVLKLVRTPFVQGADGIKILYASTEITTEYLYHYLLFDPVIMEDYKRHYSLLREKTIAFSEENSGEQQTIADCLSSIDELITAEALKLDALNAHKNGLMHQLFPAEGETVPRLRFPEFRNAGEWDIKPLETICDMQAGKFVPAAEISEKQDNDQYPCYGGNGLRGYTRTYTHSGKYPLIGRQGALCGNVILGAGCFHATEHAVVVTPNNTINIDWLFYALVLLNLNRFATGLAQPGLSVDVLENVCCATPKDEREQETIADCLSSFDALITAQSKKIDALKAHKKGLTQQLFPVVNEVQG